jgi:beta-lactamase class A
MDFLKHQCHIRQKNFLGSLILFRAKSLFVMLGLMLSCLSISKQSCALTSLTNQLQAIEERSGGRVGLSVINLGNNQRINYRADERFPMGCTSKVIGVAAILNRSQHEKALLNKRVSYNKAALTSWSPITSRYVNQGMSIQQLCQAAISYSDNTAMNLLVKELGGVSAMNEYAKTLGDKAFRQDNIWPEEAKSGGNDKRDSSTPALMASNLYQLLIDNTLQAKQHQLLQTWMLENTTGDARIRAGVPKQWRVADKTGSGTFYGTTNDIGVIYPTHCPPIVMAVYFTQPNNKQAKPNNQIVALVTKSVIQALASQDKCLRNDA